MRRLASGFVLSSRYRLEELVASGGMGQVWAGTDDVLGRRVALKVMHPETRDQQRLVRRFHAEARMAAQLSHPNIVEVYDFGEHDGLDFLVMEYIEGPTLAAVLAERGSLEPEQVRSLLVQLASALAKAHASDVVHRDLKPSNVLLTADGIAKLMDFGIATDLAGPSHTVTGEVFGTTYYISPEQAMGEPVTARSDLYSLGVLGHELITGVKPFDRPTPIATALAHVEQPPPPLPANVPEDLAEVVNACLAKDPRDRPASATAVVDRLSAATALPAAIIGEAAVVRELVEPDTPPRRAIDEDDLPSTRRWVPVGRPPRPPRRLHPLDDSGDTATGAGEGGRAREG